MAVCSLNLQLVFSPKMCKKMLKEIYGQSNMIVNAAWVILIAEITSRCPSGSMHGVCVMCPEAAHCSEGEGSW